MAPLALFGIENDGLNLVVNLILLSLLVVYVALIYWTYADARRRIGDPMLVGCATAASLFPFIGSIIYVIVRPPEFLDDVHERELEIAAAEARLNSVRQHACPHCDFDIEPGFLRCPSCLRRLKEPCTVCGKPLDPRWKICPYCEAEVGQAPAQPRRRERRVRAPGVAAREPAQAPAARAPAQAPAARAPAQAPAARQTQDGQAARQPAGGQPQRQGRAAPRQPSGGQPQRPSGAQPATRPPSTAPPANQGRPAPRQPRTDGGNSERPPSRPPASG